MSVVLWQPPRPASAPAGFDARVAALHAAVSAIGSRFSRAALASSLSAEDTVLAHAIAATGARIDVFVIDTGRLHPETSALIASTQALLGAAVDVLKPAPQAVTDYVRTHGDNGFYESVALRHACCQLRKVEPLARALAGRDAWLTGQRRAHGPDRAQLALEEHDAARGISKFNPLALWSDDELWHYVEHHALTVNPLYARGYGSIGCEPCTRALRAGEDPRAGRWWWELGGAKECGLHLGRLDEAALIEEKS